MSDAINQLKTFVQPIASFSNDEWKAFSTPWQNFSAKRKQTITAAGETEPYLYFVLEGIQRVYYADTDGREATLVLSYPPSFAGVLDSFLMQKPSRFYFDALTASAMLRLPYRHLQSLMAQYPAINNFVQLGLTQALGGLLERMVELQCYSSEEKFRKLLQRSPHILQLVPHKYLANYIGIDATNFSKLINTVKI